MAMIDMDEATLQAASDTSLLDLVARRNVEALGELYDRYANLCYSLAMRMTGDPAAASAVVHEAFRRVWDDIGRFSPARATAATWIITQVHATGLETLTLRRGRLPQDEPPSLYHPIDAGFERPVDAEVVSARERELAERRRIMRETWQRLTREQRRSLELAYFQGYSQEEIARLSAVPVQTIASEVYDALHALIDMLQPLQWT